MKLLEYEAKELFRKAGVSTPASGGVIRSAAQLPAALKRCGKGPWVIKAQVLAGGRGKAGGIRVAKTPKEAREAVKTVLGLTLVTHQTAGRGLRVREVLVEAAAKIVREIYLSVVLDRREARPILIVSGQGGMEIEAIAQQRPDTIHKIPIDSEGGLPDFAARRLAFALDLPAARVGEFCRLAQALVRLFIEHDLSLLEVNPLVLTPKGFLALDGKVIVDDNALYRHEEWAKKSDPEASALEREAKKAGISYIGLDGSIGCMVNGAGLAMGTMDTIALAGGRPANFLDVGGAATEERVAKAFWIILKDPKVKVVLVNIFGGIVKCDMIASGISGAVKKTKLAVPLVVRLQGTNVEKGRQILTESGIALVQAEDLWEAAQKAVAAAPAGAARTP